MKQLFTALLLICVCVVCSAAGVFEQVPASSSTICAVNVAELLRRPEVNKVLNTKEALEGQLEFASKAGCNITDIESAVIAIWEENRTAVLLKLNKSIDVEAAVKKFQSAEKKSVGEAVYYVINSGTISQLSGDLVVFASPQDMASFLSAPKGIPENLKTLAAKFIARNTPVAWMVFGGKSLKFSGNASYGFSGKDNNDHVIMSEIIFRKEKNAQQFAMMAPMYSGMFSGLLFGQNPELGAEVVKQFRVSNSGKTVILSINLPAALVDKVTEYAQVQGEKQLKNAVPLLDPATRKEQ